LATETELLREEVQLQKDEAREREAREAEQERLKNRVSVAAIVLTTALSFIGNVKGDRNEAAGSAKAATEAARRQSAELWAFYQTKVSERTSLEIARDRMRIDLSRGGDGKLQALLLTSYDERVRDFDRQTQQVFYRVQELEQQEDVERRRSLEPSRSVIRYELGSKLITLALILLSVTILSGKRWLLWGGIALGGAGLLVAFDGYFLLL
jgi:ATP/maltotriose-dependent transcriptional regulator MalT